MRQDALAKDLGMSAIPLREALNTLASEGLVRHVPNAGYTVARLTDDDFRQIYLMREALEDCLLEFIPMQSEESIAALKRINEDLALAASEADIPTMIRLNYDFHFTIFELSGLSLVVEELSRLWNRALPYQAIFYHDANARHRVVEEHEGILSAMAAPGMPGLSEQMSSHRRGLDSRLDRYAPHIP